MGSLHGLQPSIGTLNRTGVAVFSLSSFGGEGRGEEAVSLTRAGRFMERRPYR
jgi:hypothetical protein